MRELKDTASPGGRARSRLRSLLVAAQVAISVVLLIGAGLFVRSLQHLNTAELGFNPRDVLLANVNLSRQGYDKARANVFSRQLLERLEGIPGVQSVSSGGQMLNPGRGPWGRTRVSEGQEPAPEGDGISVPINMVGTHYFQTMGIPLMRGREFSEEHEAANADVIVINETMARQFWAGEDPIGKRLVIRQPRWFTFERRTADPHYSPTGHIVYGVNGTLRAVAFDVERLTVTGNPVPVLEGVNTKTSGAASFSLAGNGSLVYVAGGGQALSTLVWVNRDGREERLPLAPAAYNWPRLSPDGTRLAVHITESGNTDVWISDVARGTLSKLTTDAANDSYPLWARDGASVAFRSDRDGLGVYRKAADGRGAVQWDTATDGFTMTGTFSFGFTATGIPGFATLGNTLVSVTRSTGLTSGHLADSEAQLAR